MLLTRWKMMAGVLGVSLGGLATVAGQCPKTDANKSSAPDLPVVVPAAAPPKTPAASLELPKLPAAPTLIPSAAPESPVKFPVISATAPTAPADSPPPVVDAPTTPAGIVYDKPRTAAPPQPSTGGPAIGSAASPAMPPPFPADPVVESPPVKADIVKPAAAAVVSQQKYRIVLRVGEGDPTFEVRCGDDLIMKVVSEKVDIKSPEKGKGPTAVIASGMVRFAGFGAEGACEQLTFMAGTGSVEMTGEVKIQVKDKLGRVESELSTQKMMYKIDPSAINGTMKP